MCRIAAENEGGAVPLASKPHRPCASGSQRPGRRCEEPNGLREAFALPVTICRVLHDGKTVRCRTGAEAVRGTTTWASNSWLYAGRWSMTAAFGTGRSARPMPRGVRVGAQKPVAHPLRSSSRGQSAGRGGLRRMIHGRAFPTVLPWAVVRRVRENGPILATKPSSGTDRPLQARVRKSRPGLLPGTPSARAPERLFFVPERGFVAKIGPFRRRLRFNGDGRLPCMVRWRGVLPRPLFRGGQGDCCGKGARMPNRCGRETLCSQMRPSCAAAWGASEFRIRGRFVQDAWGGVLCPCCSERGGGLTIALDQGFPVSDVSFSPQNRPRPKSGGVHSRPCFPAAVRRVLACVRGGVPCRRFSGQHVAF